MLSLIIDSVIFVEK